MSSKCRELTLNLDTNNHARALWWPSATESNTLLVVHHGLGEHIGRYSALANILADQSLHVSGYDAKGHGTDSAPKGDAGTIPAMATTLAGAIPQLLEATGTERVVLMGHSMGAAVVGQYLTTHQPHESIAAVIFSAPAVAVNRTLEIKVKLIAARLLSKLAPHSTLTNGIPHQSISSAEAEVQRYLNDPLVHDRISFELGLSIIEDAEKIPSNAGVIQLPALVYQGADDMLVLRSGAEALHAGLGSAKKQLLILEGGRHESHHEREEVVATLKEALVVFLSAL